MAYKYIPKPIDKIAIPNTIQYILTISLEEVRTFLIKYNQPSVHTPNKIAVIIVRGLNFPFLNRPPMNTNTNDNSIENVPTDRPNV